MRIEKLNSDKIKVTLTSADLINLDVDIAELSPNSQELHNFLFSIMETIRLETGFNPYKGQIVVEATPSKGGICIVVSKIKPKSQPITKSEPRNGINVKVKRKRQDIAIFYFNVFDELCSAITELNREELEQSSLYRLNGTFCYILNKMSLFPHCCAVMAEFSTKSSKYPMQLTYITEHGELIAEGAKLVSMAENIKRIV